MLYISYNELGHTDGAGSQLQRIITIYMMSKYLNVGYLHTPLFKCDYQGMKCLTENKEDKSQIVDYNSLFIIKTDNPLIEEVITTLWFDEDLFSKLVTNSHSKNVLYKFTFAHLFFDKTPQCWFVPTPNYEWISSSLNTPIQVAVHIRRGELRVVDSNRMLPKEYYLQTIFNLINIFESSDILYNIKIYGESINTPITITPNHHGILGRIKEPIVLQPDDDYFDIFLNIPNVELCINESPIKTLIDLINSDCLIASRSSFSYVAGILKKKGVVLFHKFWHSLNQEWIDTSNKNWHVEHKSVILKKFKNLIIP